MRVAIVTGGAKGIGSAIAARLAQDGLAVAVLDVNADAARARAETLIQAGFVAGGYGADVGSEESMRQAFNAVVADLGLPTVLVNNAGFLRNKLFKKLRLDEWEQSLRVNATGTFIASRLIEPFVREVQWGRIVNIASTAVVGYFGAAHYSAAKSAVVGLTKSLALELGPIGVTVNAIAPGFVATDMTRQIAADASLDFDQMRAQQISQVAVRRLGEPEDIANAVSFFVSPNAGFVSGQLLYVAGGPVGLG